MVVADAEAVSELDGKISTDTNSNSLTSPYPMASNTLFI